MITRRQMLAAPLLPAACALAQPVAPPAPVASAGAAPTPATLATSHDLVDDRGWIVTAADRDAIAEARRQRLAAAAAATATPKPPAPPRRQSRPRRRAPGGRPGARG